MAILKSEIRNKFTSIPNSIIRCKDLNDGDYRLLIYLFSLPDDWKINQSYLGQELGCARENINKKLSRIKEAGYLEITKCSECKDVDYIYTLKEKVCDSNYHTPLCQQISHVIPTITHTNTDNNVINNITNTKEINNNKLLFTKKVFKKPSLEEVQSYCKERNNSINAQQFVDYYESNGWKVGRNSMKDWKAAVRTWESNEKKRSVITKKERDTSLEGIINGN